VGAGGTSLVGATPLGVTAGGALRICIDLNFWESVFQSVVRGRNGTTAQRIFAMLENGSTPFGPTQIVVSQSMLTHLAMNLEERLDEILARARERHESALVERIERIPPGTVDAWVDSIGAMAVNGPDGLAPLVFLDPSRVEPTLDHDLEDSHVLTTALRGGAHLLLTNDSHFIGPHRFMPNRVTAVATQQTVTRFVDGGDWLYMLPKDRLLPFLSQTLSAMPHEQPKQAVHWTRRELFLSPTEEERHAVTSRPHDSETTARP
jgi:hypothetical protein